MQPKSDNVKSIIDGSSVSYINMWPTVYVNFSALAATSTVAILQVPDGKGILVTANYGQIHSSCTEYNKWIATVV